jgi:hypothetical protein
MLHRRSMLLAGLVAMISSAAVFAVDPPPGPAYQIVLHSRHAEVNPSHMGGAQTGGGWVVVEQPEPNTIVVSMGGSVVAGSDCFGSSAAIAFDLEQDLDIIPTRKGVRPPRVGIVGRVEGTLQVTDAAHCCSPCGTAEQGPASACLSMGETSLLSVSVKSSAASCGQESAINYRAGPFECVAPVGLYQLKGSFHIGAIQGKGVFNRQFAVADFDPAPQLDAFWADALKPFRAVPRRDFGFKVVLRVIEDSPPALIEKRP